MSIIYQKFKILAEKYVERSFLYSKSEALSYNDIILNIEKLESSLNSYNLKYNGSLVFVKSEKLSVVASTTLLASKLGYCVCIINEEHNIDSYLYLNPNILIRDFDDIQLIHKNVSEDLENQFLLLHTSGSISNPKPVIFSESEKIKRVKLSQNLFDIRKKDAILCFGSLSYSLHIRALLASFIFEITCIRLTKNQEIDILDDNSFQNLTLFTNPHKLKELLRDKKFPEYSNCKIISTSSKASKSLKNALLNKKLKFFDCYGTTETSYATMSEGFDDNVGKQIKGVDIKILDKDKQGVGEICINSIYSNGKYFRRPFEARLGYEGSYFKTGDYGFFDKNLNLHIAQKRKDLIRTADNTIYISDLKNEVDKIEDIKDSAILNKISNENEATIIFIVRKPKSNKDGILKKIKETLSVLQITATAQFIEEIPRNDLGKINFSKLEKYE